MKTTRKPRSMGGGNGRQPPKDGRHQNRGVTNGGRPQKGASPAQSVERYLPLAREAEAAGDIVQSQYYYQHAEHYLRKENAKAGPAPLAG